MRSLYTFVLVFIFLKITGRRGVRQMSLFEVLIILTLGSAAGDVAFYDDVPLLPVLVVFVTLALLYRGIMWLMGHSEKLEDLLEGKPIVVVEEGQLAWEKLHAENMTEFEFLWSCGSTASSSLARSGWQSSKPTGRSACVYYPDEEVRAGLSILPAHCTTRYTTIPQEGIYACVRCSIVMAMQAGEKRICPRCANAEWSKASRAKRLT